MTAFLNLTPTQQPKTGATAPVNLTSLLAAGSLGSNGGVTFTNSGREVLYVQQGTAASTIVVAIGTTVEGEPVTSLTYAGVVSDIQVIGPFNEDEDFQPGDIIEITFGTPANITGVALLQNTGTY
jgi:hypothetical protein